MRTPHLDRFQDLSATLDAQGCLPLRPSYRKRAIPLRFWNIWPIFIKGWQYSKSKKTTVTYTPAFLGRGLYDARHGLSGIANAV